MRDRCTTCNKWRHVAPLAQSAAPLTDNGYGGSGQNCSCCRLQELLPWERRRTSLFLFVRTFTSILSGCGGGIVVVAVVVVGGGDGGGDDGKGKTRNVCTKQSSSSSL